MDFPQLGRISAGKRVIVTKLDDEEKGPEALQGIVVDKNYLDNRRRGVKGTVFGFVPGHGGEVWWVKHDDGTGAVYLYDELEVRASDPRSDARPPRSRGR